MAHVDIVTPDRAHGRLKRIYDDAVARAGKVYGILAVQSLAPAALDASIALYLATMKAPGALTRADREMLAVVVSRTNGCFY